MSSQNLELYFSNQVANLSWDDELKCVHLEWTGNPTDEQYKVVLNAGLELLSQKMATIWLSDARVVSVTRPLAQEWAKSDWIPRAQAAGMKQLVMVLPRDEWTQTVATGGVGAIFEMFEPRYFPALDDARQWIRDQR